MTREDEIEKLQVELYQNPQSGSFVRLAELYLGKEMTEEAVQLLQQSLKFHPQSVSGLILLGRSQRKLKLFKQALIPLAQATSLASDNWRAWLEMAEVYLEMKAAKKAHTAFKKVLFFNPTHPQARRAVAKLEVLTADEYDEDLFAMQKLSDTQPMETPEEAASEKTVVTPAAAWSTPPEGLVRVISYIDALIVRHENKKALDLLNDCTKKYGSHPEIETRRLRLSAYEQPAFIQPKSLADASKSKRELVQEKKLRVLQELLRRIESAKTRPLST
jgi:tetratricopeptide (TPR) repeat protein